MAAALVIQVLISAAGLLLTCPPATATNVRSDSASPSVHRDQRTPLTFAHSFADKLIPDRVQSSYSAAHRHSLTSLARQEDEENEGGQALDGESCSTNADCRSPRRCLDTSSILDNKAKLCSSSSDSCFCANHRICVSANDCDEGEECVLDVGYPTCISDELGLPPVEAPDEDAPPPTFGFTGELCATDADCQGTRKCRPQQQPIAEQIACGPEFVSCTCVPETFELCENPLPDPPDDSEEALEAASSDCPDGELCQTVGGDAICYTEKVRAGDIREAMKKEPPQKGVFVDNSAEEEGCARAVRRERQLRHAGAHGVVRGARDDDEDVLRAARVLVAADVREQPSLSAGDEDRVQHGGAVVHGLGGALRDARRGAPYFAGRSRRVALTTVILALTTRVRCPAVGCSFDDQIWQSGAKVARQDAATLHVYVYTNNRADDSNFEFDDF
ncbi:hypothetical protein FGB62_207g06 [Gracilaria domingensis]|nr:hypothetical protein FGB62_207g06 [Gracilaria domingensis]